MERSLKSIRSGYYASRVPKALSRVMNKCDITFLLIHLRFRGFIPSPDKSQQ